MTSWIVYCLWLWGCRVVAGKAYCASRPASSSPRAPSDSLQHLDHWPLIGRRERRKLTLLLNHAWQPETHSQRPLLDGLGLWSPPRVRLRRRRPPCLFLRKPPYKTRDCWYGWPHRGRRIGEAQNPGPAPGTPVGGERPYRRRLRDEEAMDVDGDGVPGEPATASGRVYCPVPGCMCGDPRKARGWASDAGMRAHIDAHLTGSLQGEVPASWMQSKRRQRCPVCGCSVSTQHGVHPTCRPAARQAAGTPCAARQEVGPQLPTLQEVQAGRTPTLRHVPHAARSTWARVLTRALAAVTHHNDLRSWQELLMLPQCVLDAPRRGGRKHAKAAASYTLDRLKRWEEGERLELWVSRQMPQQGPRRPLSDAERRDLATSLAREGFDSKACSALLATGLARETAETTAALQNLHPQQPAPDTPPVHELPPAPQLVPDVVAKALRSFPAASAPGPSGLRVQHLREACTPGTAAGLLEQLAAVVNLLASGHACPEVAPVLAGAGLVAVPKPKGGVRPIAIGEILRRLTGKCLMSHVRASAQEHFFPAQLGVAVPAGTEVAVHTVRAWMDRHSCSTGKVLLKLDFENAFNRVSRSQVLACTRSHFPALARWVAWTYGKHTDLRFGSTVLPSASGVQQGDPLGPLLFAAVVQPLATELRAGLDLSLFYLDDGVLAGDVAAVRAALQHIQDRAGTLGLRLNLAKGELVAVGNTSAEELAGSFPDTLIRRTDGSSRVLRDFELLGAPIGHSTFAQTHTSARVQAAKGLLEAVGQLEDPQVGLRLLRACAGHSRIVHSMRCVPTDPQLHAFRDFDELVCRCLSNLTGLHLDAAQREQAALGLGQSGLGLRSAARDAPAAYLASVGGCSDRCAQVDAQFSAAALPTRPDVLHALALVNQQGTAPLSASTALSLRQKDLTKGMDAAAWQRRLAGATIVAQATLRSEAEPGARAFLAAVPAGRKRMEPAAFVAELRQRLGVPEAAEDSWCPRCDSILDRFSHHAGLCAAGGERTLRHNALRDILCTWADRAGLQPEREKVGLLLPQRPEETGLDRRRPADIFVPSYLGSPVAFDLAVTGPQRLETLGEAARKALAAATAYADVKRQHLNTAETCRGQGVRFVPLVVEATGAWEPEAAQVLSHISRAVAAREGADASLLHAELLQDLCVVVRSFRARAALCRRAEAAEASTPAGASLAAATLMAG